MGSQRDLDRRNGGFHHQIYTSTEKIAGVKVIEKKPEYKTGITEDPPIHSNSAKMYFGKDGETERVHTLRFYENRDSIMEIQWHKIGEQNPEGTVHYHLYYKKNGKIVRDGKERKMTTEMIKEYHPLILQAFKRNTKMGLGKIKLRYNFKERS